MFDAAELESAGRQGANCPSLAGSSQVASRRLIVMGSGESRKASLGYRTGFSPRVERRRWLTVGFEEPSVGRRVIEAGRVGTFAAQPLSLVGSSSIYEVARVLQLDSPQAA